MGSWCGSRTGVAPLPRKSPTDTSAPTAVVGSAPMLDQPAFRSVGRRVVVPPEEAPACNVLAVGSTVGSTVVLPAGCPRTAAAVHGLGLEVREVDLGEFHKADGGATCLSLLV
jgi:N-dimethylarginine dimethylaminohydrolase